MTRSLQIWCRRVPGGAALLVVGLMTAACNQAQTTGGSDSDLSLDCSISRSEIFNGGPGKNGIPSLTNPETSLPYGDGLEYLDENDRVMGLRIDGEALAVPLNILWWHEIVNVELGTRQLAITHCPLTGSSLVFDRAPLEGVEFGVSGLLYRNNLMMYDRSSGESLWPQMSRGARCGPQTGTALTMVPLVEMTWEGWRTLHPDTRVVSSFTGFERDYTVYPYGDYDEEDNGELLFPFPDLDDRRPPKERVLGIPSGSGGWAFPFGELTRLGTAGAIHSGGAVVFWDSWRQAAMAYVPMLDGSVLEFTSDGTTVTDETTGSTWTVDGRAVDGPLEGRRLEAVPEAYVAYWFAWAEFQPETELWVAP